MRINRERQGMEVQQLALYTVPTSPSIRVQDCKSGGRGGELFNFACRIINNQIGQALTCTRYVLRNLISLSEIYVFCLSWGRCILPKLYLKKLAKHVQSQ